MSARNLDYLQGYLARGDCFLGQVRIGTDHSLSHLEEEPSAECTVFTDPHDAITIARYDDAGKFRPLKTAPNLRHGWRLKLADASELLLALDFLYPAAIGTALDFEESRLQVVPLRSTLERQSGMYAVVKKITDEQAGTVIRETCDPQGGCLRRILWPISSDVSSPRQEARGEISFGGQKIPLLCPEACNLLVAAGRSAVKSATSQAG